MTNTVNIPKELNKYDRRQFRKNWELEKQTKLALRQKNQKRAQALGILVILITLGIITYKKVTKPLPGTLFASLGNAHIPSVLGAHDPYNSIPPTSGPHVGDLADWGIHDIPIPDELQLHNLEDGGVAMQYNCTFDKSASESAVNPTEITDNCQDLVNKLSLIAKRYKDKVLLAPYPKLDQQIALTAWQRLDKFSDFDETRIINFIEAYRGIDHHQK